MGLKDLPLDLIQEITVVLDRYVQARRRQKLLQEQARLQEELQDMRTDLAEIHALASHPAQAAITCRQGGPTGVERNMEENDHA